MEILTHNRKMACISLWRVDLPILVSNTCSTPPEILSLSGWPKETEAALGFSATEELSRHLVHQRHLMTNFWIFEGSCTGHWKLGTLCCDENCINVVTTIMNQTVKESLSSLCSVNCPGCEGVEYKGTNGCGLNTCFWWSTWWRGVGSLGSTGVSNCLCNP